MTFIDLGPKVLRTVGGQLSVLIIAAFAVWNVATIAIVLSLEGGRGALPWFGAAAEREVASLDFAASALSAAPPDRRPEMAAVLQHRMPSLALVPPGEITPRRQIEFDFERYVQLKMATPAIVADISQNFGAPEVEITLEDGTRFRAKLDPEALSAIRPIVLPLSILTGLGFTLTLLLWWTGRWLTVPLSRFAEAVENAGDNRDIEGLPTRGPAEILKLVKAFRQMRHQIVDLLAARTSMLVAISHDLRTPLARLGFYAERVEDPVVRDKITGEIAGMAGLIQSAMEYLRGNLENEPAQSFDLAALMQTEADEYAESGASVQYVGPARFIFTGRVTAVRRMIVNLIDNARRYGTSVVVRLTVIDGQVTIAVEDDGPGISDDQKDLVLQPFTTGNAARTGGTGSFGLGLSIVRSLAQSHGGTLRLEDAKPQGLRALITLPR